METLHLAAIQAGVDPDAFWAMTPYQVVTRVKAANKAKMEDHLMIGWFSERFAREKELRSPDHYIKEFLTPTDPALAEAEAMARFHRMAEDWGLAVEDAN